MSATISVPTDTQKTVAMVLTFGIHAWLKAEAKRQGKSISAVGRDAIEAAMQKSEAERKDVA